MNSKNTFNLSRSRQSLGPAWRLITAVQPLNLEYLSESCFARINNPCQFYTNQTASTRYFNAVSDRTNKLIDTDV